MLVSNFLPTNGRYALQSMSISKLLSTNKETLPMKKLTIRYIRYALALLANIGYLGQN